MTRDPIPGAQPSGRWEVTSQRIGASPLLGFHPLFRSMTTDITQKFGLDMQVEYLVQFKNRHVKMAAYIPDWEQLGDETIKHLERAEFIDWITSGLARTGQRLFELGDTIRSLNTTELSRQGYRVWKSMGEIREHIGNKRPA